jgi:integrase
MGQGARPPVTRKLRYLKSYRDRHGRERHYFRRPGSPPIPLPGEHGSKAFMDAYWALMDNAPTRELGEDKTVPGSVAALVALYYKSPAFKKLTPKTRATYRGLLEEFRRDHGDKPIRGMRQRHVVAILDGREKNQQNWRKVIRLALNLAVERGWIDTHPMAGVRRSRKPLQGFRAWSPDDIAAFEARWPSGTRERLALALLLYTGQRRGDVVGMGRQHVQRNGLRVKQRKTDTELVLPLHPRLRAELAHVPATQLTFLLTQYGQPFTANGFGNWFREVAREAGLPPRSNAHGLRKAAAVMLAEAGCTPSQIMAVTGHKNLSEVTLYTAAADQERLAAEAMRKVEARTKLSNPNRPGRQKAENV